MGLPIQRVLNQNCQGPYTPGIINTVLSHGEESSKAVSLDTSNVRFDVMLESPVPLPCHPWVSGPRFWCKGSSDFIKTW